MSWYPGSNLGKLLETQRAWSLDTFGPGLRTDSILDHIAREIIEVREDPTNVVEWLDIAILALDGAWRTGATDFEVVRAFLAKSEVNRERTWPDWRTADPTKAIEHLEEP